MKAIAMKVESTLTAPIPQVVAWACSAGVEKPAAAKMLFEGAVTPTWIGAALGLEGALTSGRGGGSPRPERFVSQDAKRTAGSEMTLDVERVVGGGMNGQEALS
jgi:hypothetical protein